MKDKDKEKVRILRNALEEIYRVTTLNEDERLAFAEKYASKKADYWACAVGYIRHTADCALNDVKEGD